MSSKCQNGVLHRLFVLGVRVVRLCASDVSGEWLHTHICMPYTYKITKYEDVPWYVHVYSEYHGTNGTMVRVLCTIGTRVHIYHMAYGIPNGMVLEYRWVHVYLFQSESCDMTF
jgi:hypothetical protein